MGVLGNMIRWPPSGYKFQYKLGPNFAISDRNIQFETVGYSWSVSFHDIPLQIYIYICIYIYYISLNPNLYSNLSFRGGHVSQWMDQWISCQLEALNSMVNHQFPIKMANDSGYTTMLEEQCHKHQPPMFWWFIPPIWGKIGMVHYCFTHIIFLGKSSENHGVLGFQFFGTTPWVPWNHGLTGLTGGSRSRNEGANAGGRAFWVNKGRFSSQFLC
jgi:hypothetical protein